MFPDFSTSAVELGGKRYFTSSGPGISVLVTCVWLYTGPRELQKAHALPEVHSMPWVLTYVHQHGSLPL